MNSMMIIYDDFHDDLMMNSIMNPMIISMMI